MGFIWFPEEESSFRQTPSASEYHLPVELPLSGVSGEMDISSGKMDLPCPLKTTKIKSFITLAGPDLCCLCRLQCYSHGQTAVQLCMSKGSYHCWSYVCVWGRRREGEGQGDCLFVCARLASNFCLREHHNDIFGNWGHCHYSLLQKAVSGSWPQEWHGWSEIRVKIWSHCRWV